MLDADRMQRDLLRRRVLGLMEARGAIIGALVVVVTELAFWPQRVHGWSFLGLVGLAAFVGAFLDAESHSV